MKSRRANDDLLRLLVRRMQIGQRYNFKPADKVQRAIRDQTRLCKSDGDRKIGSYTVTIYFP